MPELTEYEYGYLKGDKEMWPGWGAAFGATLEWCRNQGYGSFGEPTERGLEAIRRYEQSKSIAKESDARKDLGSG